MDKSKIINVLAEEQLLIEASISETVDYNKAVSSGTVVPDNLIKVDNTVYKKPDKLSSDELLYAIVYSTIQTEQHIRFIKKCIIASIILSIVSVLIGLFL